MSAIIIAVYDGSPGGTADCYDRAVKWKRQIIRINPKELLISK